VLGVRDGQGGRMAEKGKNCGGQSSKAFTVEKMTATSTTSPKTESSIENEDKEIQNILDKKRKKRRKQSNSKDSKQSRLEGVGSSIHQKYFEASRELETTQRISQDLPNCNWLEQKIKLSEKRNSLKFTGRINSAHASDSEEDNLIVDDVFEETTGVSVDEETSVPEVIKSVPSTSTLPKSEKKSLQVVEDDVDGGDVARDDPEGGGAHILFSPPCITIKEEEGRQPIQIRLNITGENNQFLFDGLQAHEEENTSRHAGENYSHYKHKIGNSMKKTDFFGTDFSRSGDNQNIRADSDTRNEDTKQREENERKKEDNEKMESLLALREEIEKDIESLKNKKIQEMEELIEIKTTKEKYMNELENLRMDVFKEKNLLNSLKHNNSLEEKNLQETPENQIRQFHGSSATDKVSPKVDLNQPLSSQLIHPSNIPRQPSMISHNPQSEMLGRYPHEKVQTPTTSRPGPELDYRPGAPGLVSPPLASLARDYSNHTHQLYKQMVESAGRIWKPEDRLRELGIQPPRLPGMTRQYEHYPGLGLPPPMQYSRGFPPLPPDTTLSHIAHPPRYSGHPARSPPQPHAVRSPPRPPPPPVDMADSQCEACGAAANFMCSACKGAHYCSTLCQGRHWVVHNRACLQNQRK